MKPALRYQHQEPPHDWSEIPQGPIIKQHINTALKAWWPKLFGYHMLKIGNLSCELDTAECAIKHQIGVGEHSHLAGVVADIDELPFGQHTVDVAILSHCLEFYPDPHHLIREADRVLIPDGYMIITGYNPYSFCGLAKPLHVRSERFPWSGRFFTPAPYQRLVALVGI